MSHSTTPDSTARQSSVRSERQTTKRRYRKSSRTCRDSYEVKDEFSPQGHCSRSFRSTAGEDDQSLMLNYPSEMKQFTPAVLPSPGRQKRKITVSENYSRITASADNPKSTRGKTGARLNARELSDLDKKSHSSGAGFSRVSARSEKQFETLSTSQIPEKRIPQELLHSQFSSPERRSISPANDWDSNSHLPNKNSEPINTPRSRMTRDVQKQMREKVQLAIEMWKKRMSKRQPQALNIGKGAFPCPNDQFCSRPMRYFGREESCTRSHSREKKKETENMENQEDLEEQESIYESDKEISPTIECKEIILPTRDITPSPERCLKTNDCLSTISSSPEEKRCKKREYPSNTSSVCAEDTDQYSHRKSKGSQGFMNTKQQSPKRSISPRENSASRPRSKIPRLVEEKSGKNNNDGKHSQVEERKYEPMEDEDHPIDEEIDGDDEDEEEGIDIDSLRSSDNNRDDNEFERRPSEDEYEPHQFISETEEPEEPRGYPERKKSPREQPSSAENLTKLKVMESRPVQDQIKPSTPKQMDLHQSIGQTPIVVQMLVQMEMSNTDPAVRLHLIKQRQRQEIYALNKIMTELEFEQFENFCRENSIPLSI